MTSFTDAIATDLDPGELFELRAGLAIPRGAVLAILAFLDLHGIDDVRPPAPTPTVAEWAVDVLARMDPGEVEADVLDAVTPGSGRYATTRATIAYCMAAIREAAVAEAGRART